MFIIGLSETKRSRRGEISSRGDTYYWFGMVDKARLRGIAPGTSSRLHPFRVEVTSVDERMMSQNEGHFGLHFSCCTQVYASTEKRRA